MSRRVCTVGTGWVGKYVATVPRQSNPDGKNGKGPGYISCVRCFCASCCQKVIMEPMPKVFQRRLMVVSLWWSEAVVFKNTTVVF